VVGFIAQEVQPLFPDVVDEKDGYFAIAYDGFGPVAIGAIQELNQKVDRKDAEIAAQREAVSELKTQVEAMSTNKNRSAK
jgi:hypothetical protein